MIDWIPMDHYIFSKHDKICIQLLLCPSVNPKWDTFKVIFQVYIVKGRDQRHNIVEKEHDLIDDLSSGIQFAELKYQGDKDRLKILLRTATHIIKGLIYEARLKELDI